MDTDTTLMKYGDEFHRQLGGSPTGMVEDPVVSWWKDGYVRATLSLRGRVVPIWDYNLMTSLPVKEKLGGEAGRGGAFRVSAQDASRLLEADSVSFTAIISRAEEIGLEVIKLAHGGWTDEYLYKMCGDLRAAEICKRELAMVTQVLPDSREDWHGWYEGKMARSHFDHHPYHWYRLDPRHWLAAGKAGVAVEYSPEQTFPDGDKLAWVWCTPDHARKIARDPMNVEEYLDGLLGLQVELAT